MTRICSVLPKGARHLACDEKSEVLFSDLVCQEDKMAKSQMVREKNREMAERMPSRRSPGNPISV